MKDFFYLCPDGRVAKVTSAAKPSAKTKPKSGVWKLLTYGNRGWINTLFPVTWDQLATLKYIGSISKPKVTGFAE